MPARSDYLAAVRQHYEKRPFPARDPGEEQVRLVVSPVDILAKVNHYCFAGRRSFGDGFTALVAGGGTGDSAIFLAHQLAGVGARVTYLDISEASMRVARQRAAVRGLDNIDWRHGSILDLPALEIGPFDYITSLGVLHHLESPDAGLAALASVLAEDGGMALMLYGTAGRIHTYQTQGLMRQIVGDEQDLQRKLDMAKACVNGLPPTNLFRAREGDGALRDKYLGSETVLLDDLLSPRDRAYTAEEVHAFVARAGLEVAAFTTYQGVRATSRLQYDLALYLHDRGLFRHAHGLPLPQRQTLAETIDGSIALHTVYASRGGRVADFGDERLVPMLLTSQSCEGVKFLAQNPGRGIEIVLRNSLVLKFNPGPASRACLAAVDGQASLADILYSHCRGGPGDEARAQVLRDFEFLNALDWVVLRAPGGAAFEPIPMAGVLEHPYHYSQPVAVENAAAARVRVAAT